MTYPCIFMLCSFSLRAVFCPALKPGSASQAPGLHPLSTGGAGSSGQSLTGPALRGQWATAPHKGVLCARALPLPTHTAFRARPREQLVGSSLAAELGRCNAWLWAPWGGCLLRLAPSGPDTWGAETGLGGMLWAWSWWSFPHCVSEGRQPHLGLAVLT